MVLFESGYVITPYSFFYQYSNAFCETPFLDMTRLSKRRSLAKDAREEKRRKKLAIDDLENSREAPEELEKAHYEKELMREELEKAHHENE